MPQKLGLVDGFCVVGEVGDDATRSWGGGPVVAILDGPPLAFAGGAEPGPGRVRVVVIFGGVLVAVGDGLVGGRGPCRCCGGATSPALCVEMG